MGRLGEISEGFKGTTGDSTWKKLVKMFQRDKEEPVEIEERGPVEGLGMEWEELHDEFMESGELEEMGDEELMSLYSGLRDWEGETREEIIEELMRYRDRKYR